MGALDGLVIIEACRTLVLRYSWLSDSGLNEDASRCFVPEGELEIDGKRIAGRDAIKARLDGRPPDQLSRHYCFPSLVEVASEELACATTYVQLLRGIRAPRGPAAMDLPLAAGRYEDEIRLWHGQWLFASRRLRWDFLRSDR